MREKNIRDRNLRQSLNWRSEEPAKDILRNPLPFAACVRTPERQRDGREGGDYVRRAFSVLQGEGLPEEQAPATQEEEVAGAGVDVCDGEVEGGGEGRFDAVDEGVADAREPDVDADAGEVQEFAVAGPG